MKFLFVFAHPDDETIGCAGTIHQLVQQGHDVILATATEGGAGDVMKEATEKFEELGKNVKNLRRFEMAQAVQHLGISQHYFLNYEDGEITNKEVWGSLKEDIIEIIDRELPDFILTFDHTGWYFHLDHVGVSIATTWAYKQSIYRPKGLLLSHLRVEGSKWEYSYPRLVPDYAVEINDIQHKVAAIDLHLSQDLVVVKNFILSQITHKEWYQFAGVEKDGKDVLERMGIFKPVEDKTFYL